MSISNQVSWTRAANFSKHLWITPLNTAFNARLLIDIDWSIENSLCYWQWEKCTNLCRDQWNKQPCCCRGGGIEATLCWSRSQQDLPAREYRTSLHTFFALCATCTSVSPRKVNCDRGLAQKTFIDFHTTSSRNVYTQNTHTATQLYKHSHSHANSTSYKLPWPGNSIVL